MKKTIFNSQYYLFLILIIYFFYYFFQISEYYIFHENWNALKNVEENPIGAIKRLDYDGFTNYLKNIYVILINTSERIFFDYFYFPPNFHSFTQGRYLGYINGNITDILINKISDAKYVRLIGLISISLYLFSILHYLKKYMNRNESILFLILFSTLPFFSYKILNGTFFIINFFFFINFLLSAVAVEYFKKINLKNIFFQNVAFLALYFVFNLLFLFYFPTLSFMILFPAVIVIFYSHDNETTKKIFF